MDGEASSESVLQMLSDACALPDKEEVPGSSPGTPTHESAGLSLRGWYRTGSVLQDGPDLLAVDQLGHDRVLVADQAGDLFQPDATVGQHRDEAMTQLAWGPVLAPGRAVALRCRARRKPLKAAVAACALWLRARTSIEFFGVSRSPDLVGFHTQATDSSTGTTDQEVPLGVGDGTADLPISTTHLKIRCVYPQLIHFCARSGPQGSRCNHFSNMTAWADAPNGQRPPAPTGSRRHFTVSSPRRATRDESTV
jgi:hypothetical protein